MDRANNLQPERGEIVVRCNRPVSNFVASQEMPQKQKAREKISRAIDMLK
jgi:hypothetical protein